MSSLQSAEAARSPLATIGRIPGVAFALVLMLVVFSSIAPGFLSAANITNILTQSTVLLLIALPMTLIIMTEGIDLSLGAILTLCSIVFALTVIATDSLVLALVASMLVGTVFGLGNGILTAHVGIPPFVATLGVMGMVQGVALIVSDSQTIVGIPYYVRAVYSGNLFGVPWPIVIGAAAYLAFYFLLYRTRFGTYVVAVGGNREALTLAGLRWRSVTVAVYALGGLMAGIGAMLFTARLNSAHPTAAIGMEFDAIAAVALGGTSFDRGNGWLFGTLLGVLAVGLLRNGLNLAAVPSSAQVTCIGLLVILALLVDGTRNAKS